MEKPGLTLRVDLDSGRADGPGKIRLLEQIGSRICVRDHPEADDLSLAKKQVLIPPPSWQLQKMERVYVRMVPDAQR